MNEIKLEPVDPCLPDGATAGPKLEIFDYETDVKTDPDTFVKVEEDYCLNDPVCDIVRFIRDKRAMLTGNYDIFGVCSLVCGCRRKNTREQTPHNELPLTTTCPPIAF